MMKIISAPTSIVFVLLKSILLIVVLIWLFTGCLGQQSTPVAVESPTISDPRISAPTPQEPGEEIGISIDVSSAIGVSVAYEWKADGGEIVRGQGSPAITYRTPEEPGIYNVRVTVSWDNSSVEKITTIRVEAPASEPPTDTPAPGTSDAPADADPTVYDNFNNPANEGGYNKELWMQEWDSNPGNQVGQENGVIKLVKQGVQHETNLTSKKYFAFSIDHPTFFEAKLMLKSESNTGNVSLSLRTQENDWYDSCMIYNSTREEVIAACFEDVGGTSIYDTEEVPVEWDTWHIVRIEVDPTAMTFTYFVDGRWIGSHTPFSAEQFKQTKFTLRIGVFSHSPDYSVVGYIDDVRVGQVEQ